MAIPSTEVQKLVTQAIIDLVEFDFSTISGASGNVYIASSLQDGSGPSTGQQIKYVWDGNSYEHVDFRTNGLSSDSTGSIAEPTLEVAANTLFSISGWPTLDLIEYRGVIVKRRRVFEDGTTPLAPQRYYIKKVSQFNTSTITFVLTPSLGFEQLNRASTRKMEL